LFLSEIHENMYIRGLTKSIPGKTFNVASVSLQILTYICSMHTQVLQCVDALNR
jgi:hypothetical protein